METISEMNNTNAMKKRVTLLIEDEDEVGKVSLPSEQQQHKPVYKFDLYNNPEYIAANIESELFEQTAEAIYYRTCFCLQQCGEYKIREHTLREHYKSIEPYVTNTFEDVLTQRKKQLCVLIKGHPGKCSDKANIFKQNETSEKLVKSIESCIYQTPGNDDYIYKNRSPRLHPIHIPRSIEKQIRDKTKKLKCAIPLCEYSTPFMLATAYVDWLCYLLSIQDISHLIKTELPEEQRNFISVLQTQHKHFVSNHFLQYDRKIFDENNNNAICVITKKIVLTKDVSDPSRDNRTNIDPHDIQLGHIKSRNDSYFSVRGLNILMMSRDGNRIIGEDSFIENKWIEKLKNIIKHYL
jgi:hypothetical protein